jgi:hypothetical protein
MKASGHPVKQRLAGAEAAAVFGNYRHAALQRLTGEPCEMRRHDDVRQAQQRIVRADRLARKYIEAGATQPAA